MALRSSGRKPVHSYSQVQVNTADPGKRVVMMYDGILKNLRIAKANLDDVNAENIQIIHNALQLTQKLILELQLALDHENGGELAATLEGLYAFWLEQLSDINLKKEPGTIDDIITMVRELRNTWQQAVTDARKQGIL